MKNNQDYKNAALAALKGNWAPALVASVTVTFVICLIIAPTYCANMAAFRQPGFAWVTETLMKVFNWTGPFRYILLLYPLMMVGYQVAHNDLLVSGDPRVTGNTFRHTFSGYLRNVWAMFLMYMFTFLWALLLFIPGIIKSLAYAMTPFIIKDYPELSANQAINLSMKMMKGRKFDLFWLTLSFLGWVLLCMLSLGIGLFWFMPYWQTTLAAFYQDVKHDYINNNTNL